jgi:hypothetical protein
LALVVLHKTVVQTLHLIQFLLLVVVVVVMQTLEHLVALAVAVVVLVLVMVGVLAMQVHTPQLKGMQEELVVSLLR